MKSEDLKETVSAPLHQKGLEIIDDSVGNPADHSKENTEPLLDDVELRYVQLKLQNEELRRANSELVRSRKCLENRLYLYRSLAANLPNGAAFIVDTNLRYLLAQGQALNAAGMTPDQFEGKTIYEALPPDLAALYEPNYRTVLGGRPNSLKHASHHRHFLTHLKPLYDDQGHVYAALAVSYDITDQEIVTEQLKESESRFRTMADGLPLIIWVHDADGRQEFVNRTFCDYFGVTIGEMLADRWKELVHPDDAKAYSERFMACVNDRRPFNALVRVRRADGEWRWMESWGKPRMTSSGQYLGSVGASADVTDRVKAEALRNQYEEMLESKVNRRTLELKRKNNELKNLNKITKKLAHRTIDAMENERQALAKEIHDSIAGTLAAIKMQLEGRVIEMEASNHGSPSELMSFESILDHLTQVIKETKRVSWQLRSSVLEEYGLKSAMEEHINKFKTFHPAIDVAAHFELCRDDIHPKVQTAVYRIFQEAMNNVSKHSEANEVKVHLSNDHNSQIHLIIEDNGCGFVQSAAFSDEGSLTGFGLHSMRERTEMFNGVLKIHTEPGKGTKVDITIPFQ